MEEDSILQISHLTQRIMEISWPFISAQRIRF
jgi:hypothetical protein